MNIKRIICRILGHKIGELEIGAGRIMCTCERCKKDLVYKIKSDK